MQGRAPNLVYVPLVASVIFAMTGCGAFDPPDAQMAGICADNNTNRRVEDDRCGDFDDQGIAAMPGYYYSWIPMNSSYPVPAVGQEVPRTIGQRSVPAGTPITRGVPIQGATSMSTIQRGGFGKASGSTSGIGSKAGSGGKAGGSAGS